jgi:hypothetical protein
MSFDAVILAAVYNGPDTVAIDVEGDPRGFLEVETVTASDGAGLVRHRRTSLRVIAGSVPDKGVDDELLIGEDTYRIVGGPDPIDDGAEEEFQLVGPVNES